MPVAFAVRKDYESTYEPGVIAVGDHTLNLAELLTEGDGQIVVADTEHILLSRLDEQPALKRVPVRTAEDTARAAAARASRKRYDAMTAKDLRDGPVKQAGLDLPQSASKQELVDALVAHDEANWTPETVTEA